MAALTAIAIGAAIVGTGTQIYGQIKANHAQAEAERANAAFYKEQADFADAATKRELSLFSDQVDEFFGKQTTQFAAGGVELQGSPLMALANTRMKAAKEATAITEDGRAKVREAMLKAGASLDDAERLSSFSANGLPAIGAGLQTGASLYSQFGRTKA